MGQNDVSKPDSEPLPPTLSLSQASDENSSVSTDDRRRKAPAQRPISESDDLNAAAAGAEPPLPSASRPEDDLLASEDFEHYTVLRRADGRSWELGRGAMGVTYKALDTRLECPVALKVINSAFLAKHPAARERFFREARAAARLRHPNVASVFHLGERASDGQCFYVMEFIDGETLEARVRRRGPLPVSLALEVTAQAARALMAASGQGLVHRDLKPANLMLIADVDRGRAAGLSQTCSGADAVSADGTLVKVIDFGLARLAADGAPADTGSFAGFVGTPHFASPEQFAASADGTSAADARSDLYSLGVTLWYLLTGKVPFPGRSLAEIAHRQLHEPLPVGHLAAARVPQPVGELLASMLAADPAERPPTPQALVEALRACREALPAAAPVATGWTPALAHAGSRRRSTLRTVATLAALIVLLIGAALAGAGYYRLLPWFQGAADKSIAVLPFENLSTDQENAFFADGVQDDVLTSLSKIGKLRVISRASVAGYRDPASRASLAKIGQALGVAHLVEGTVRRAGNRIVISVKLIDAASGEQLWAEKYDRTLSDALSLQGQVAAEIASALRTTLSPEERASVAARPTENTDAYVLYLRARETLSRAAFKRDGYEAAARLYEEAIALDPSFALAHARLSQTRNQIAHFFEPTPALHAAARASAEEALRLRPDLGEAHLARALVHYWIDRDLIRASEEFAIASRGLPNDADIAAHLAAIQRRRGRWAECIAGFERAMALNPRNPDIPYDLAIAYAATGDWPAAARMADRAVALAPDVPLLKLWRADLLFDWKGDYSMLKAALAEMPPSEETGEITATLRYQVAMVERDYAAAEAALAASPKQVFTIFDYGAPRPADYLRGLIYLARDDRAEAEKFLQKARPICEAAVREAPADAYRHAQLGLVYAALGWHDAALGESWFAGQLLPEEKDVADGTTITARRAQIHALLGDADRAVPLLDHLLKTPSPELLSVQDLRLRPEWDRLRGDARFRQLLAANGG